MQQKPPPVSSQQIVTDYLRLLKTPLAAPELSVPALSTVLPDRLTGRPCALILSPHPDDECLTGILPLRLLREQNWQILNIPATLGSNRARQNERKKELAKACAVLGFACVLPEEDGFLDINAAARSTDASAWSKKVERIAAILAQIRPQAIFMPHEGDQHTTHTGTHWLGMDALAIMPKDFTCAVVLTEYWQPMAMPNTVIGIGENDVSTLMSALACHVGEVSRNAFDRRFPAYLIDTVRRCERLSGKGTVAPAMDFAQMYGLGSWLRGKFAPSALKRFIGAEASLGALFE
jgi:N-acetylglucosamine malate deacetylase 1